MCNICRPLCVLVYGTLRPGRMNAPGITEPTEVITRARAGDAEAWGELYHDYAPAIFRFCRRALPTREDAEDATMEIFMKLKAAGAVRCDAVVLGLALQGGGEPLLGHAAAAQDSPGQRKPTTWKMCLWSIQTPASWNS